MKKKNIYKKITAKGEFPKIELEQSKYITKILGIKKTDIILIEAPKYLPKDNNICFGPFFYSEFDHTGSD